MKTVYRTIKNRAKLKGTSKLIAFEETYNAGKLFNAIAYDANRKLKFKEKQQSVYKIIKNIKDNPHKKLLVAHAAQRVAYSFDDGRKAAFEQWKKGKYARFPQAKRDRHYKLEYHRNETFRKHKTKHIALVSIGKYSKQKHGKQYLECKIPPHIPFEKIKTITLLPSNKGQSFHWLITYEKELQEKEIEGGVMGLDPGQKYILSGMHTNNGQGFLISGTINETLRKLNVSIDKKKNKTKKRLLYEKKKRVVNDYIEKVSTYVIKKAMKEDIGTIIIGNNKGQKNGINIGKKNNRKFYQTPHWLLQIKLASKAEDNNIKIIETEENYTSKCSFLSQEKLEKHENYQGERVHRGLFKCPKGTLHSDINGAGNIIRKVLGNEFINKTIISNIQLYSQTINL